MARQFDSIAAAREFFYSLPKRQTAILRLTQAGNFVFSPASDAIGHPTTIVMASTSRLAA